MIQMTYRYDFIDHTADVCVKAYGETLAVCFESAAKAMFDIISDESKINDVGEYIIKLKADDIDQLLVDWLSELLFLHSSRNIIFGSFSVELNENKIQLEAHVKGEEIDQSIHKIGVEIKAVTYHMLEIHNEKPFSVQVLFDI